jgi:hypothetical protein
VRILIGLEHRVSSTADWWSCLIKAVEAEGTRRGRGGFDFDTSRGND